MDKRYAILLVDDEEAVLNSLRRTFRVLSDCEILMTTSPKRALEIVAQRKIDLIISDQRMFEMEGVLLLKRVKEIRPETVRILLSGYSDLNALADAIHEGDVFRFISKPWENESLLGMVQFTLKQQDMMKFVDNVINRLQQQMKSPSSIKVEALHESRHVRIKLETDEALVSHEEMKQVIDMILQDVAGSPQGGGRACGGGVVEKKDGKTFLSFDLAEGLFCITVELPVGRKAV